MTTHSRADWDRALETLGYPTGLAQTFATVEYCRIGAVADALAAERRRAAEDGQRLRERVEALIDELEQPTEPVCTPEWEDGYDCAREDDVRRLRAALRDDTGDGR